MLNYATCKSCHRRFLTGELKAGAKYHCLCGHWNIVEPISTEAPSTQTFTKNCAACGGPVAEDATSCKFCGAGISEQSVDLDNLCHMCFIRIPSSSKFCMRCGTQVEAAATLGEPILQTCPDCKNPPRLRHQILKAPGIQAEECERCHGLWIDRNQMEVFIKYASEQARASIAPAKRSDHNETESKQDERNDRPYYKKCPYCSNLMQRTNFGKRSGTITDVCAAHGVWLNHDELGRIYDFITSGRWLDAIKSETEMIKQQHAAAERMLEMDKIAENRSRGHFPSSIQTNESLSIADLIISTLLPK